MPALPTSCWRRRNSGRDAVDDSLRGFWLAALDFRTTLTSRRYTANQTDHALGLQNGIFISPCRFDNSVSFYQRVGGIQLIVGSHQSKIHKSTALKWQDAHYRYAVRLTWITVVFVDRVGVFLEHVHRTWKASEWFMSNFSVISLYIACLLTLIASTTTAATFT